MKHEEHDELWDLMGRARPVRVSPFFARNVLREVRTLSQDQTGFRSWFRRHWQLPAAAFAAFALAAVALFEPSHGLKSPPSLRSAHATATPAALEDPQLLVMAEKVSSSPDYHVIGHLDELLDSERNSIWLGSDSF